MISLHNRNFAVFPYNNHKNKQKKKNALGNSMDFGFEEFEVVKEKHEVSKFWGPLN